MSEPGTAARAPVPLPADCVRHLFVSAGHNYFGHHGQPVGTHALAEVNEIECVAGSGIRGDRFFDHKPDYKGQITFFSLEVFETLRQETGHAHAQPGALRRNVVTTGIDLNALIGREFVLQGVRFFGTEECRPCYWMDGAIGPGSEAWLRGRGGLRARILSDGWVRKHSPSELRELSGAVMAGGASRRMGRDKALLTLNGQPLWLHQASVLRAAGADPIGVVRQHGQAPLLPFPSGISLWHDAVADAGPLAGLHAALDACTTHWLAVLATDMPRIDATWFHWLRPFCHSGCGAIARHPDGGYEPLAAIYPRTALAEVARRLHAGPRSLQALAAALIADGRLTVVPLPPAEVWRVENWNTPAEAGAGYESNPTAFATASQVI